jgi:hypothetical protein
LRKTLLSLAAVGALAVPSVALAGGGDPDPTYDPPTAGTLPTIPSAVPLPTLPPRVTSLALARRFSNAFAVRNAARFLGQDRDRVRVTDVLSTCLRSPVSAGQFGCVFALNAAVVTRNTDDYDWGTLARVARVARVAHPPVPVDPTDPPVDPDTGLPVDPPTFAPGNQRRIQVQRFGCLGEIDIRGGASVTPIASVHFLRCARVPGRTINYPIATPLPSLSRASH